MPVNISKMKNCYWLDKNIFFKKINKNNDMRYVNKNHLGMIDEEGPVSFLRKFHGDEVSKKINEFMILFYFGEKMILMQLIPNLKF